MIQRLMDWYGRLPADRQGQLRRRVVTPGKRLLSRGVIAQPGFVIAKRLDQSIPFKIWREGCYEPHLSDLFRKYLRPGDTFVDVGANVGYFTLLAAACVGPTGHVHSFEPNPRVFKELQRNVMLNRFSQVALNNCALSNRAETIQLWVNPEIDSGLASMRRTSELLTETFACEAVTLDQYVAQKEPGKVRAMKLDVEGAELLVVQGAENLLDSADRPDLIALEAVQSHAASFNTTTSAVAQFLLSKGYILYYLGATEATFRLELFNIEEGVPDGTLVAAWKEALA